MYFLINLDGRYWHNATNEKFDKPRFYHLNT